MGLDCDGDLPRRTEADTKHPICIRSKKAERSSSKTGTSIKVLTATVKVANEHEHPSQYDCTSRHGGIVSINITPAPASSEKDPTRVRVLSGASKVRN